MYCSGIIASPYWKEPNNESFKPCRLDRAGGIFAFFMVFYMFKFDQAFMNTCFRSGEDCHFGMPAGTAQWGMLGCTADGKPLLCSWCERPKGSVHEACMQVPPDQAPCMVFVWAKSWAHCPCLCPRSVGGNQPGQQPQNWSRVTLTVSGWRMSYALFTLLQSRNPLLWGRHR